MLDLRKMVAVERVISGVRSQCINGMLSVIYGFLKDGREYGDEIDASPYFWLKESACFATREELIKTIEG